MNAKHTPGPWTYNGKSRAVYAGRVSVANCTRNAVGESTDANCRLIAAAPELLAAMEAIVFQVVQGKVLERDACIAAARAAIAKATTEAAAPARPER